jgi:hypothetical protein
MRLPIATDQRWQYRKALQIARRTCENTCRNCAVVQREARHDFDADCMRTFTLDTNCLVAIDEGRPEAAHVRTLADAHAAGKVHVAVVAMSASEKQKDGRYIKNFEEYCERLAALGLAHLDILKPMAYWDICFWDWCLWSGPDMQSLEKQIHTILFPAVEFSWQDHCRANGLDPATSSPSREYHKWRNCKCDVRAIWSHIHGKRDVFVTSDGKFFAATKRSALISLGAKGIECPEDAISLL